MPNTIAASAASAHTLSLDFLGKLGGKNTRGNRKDGVAQQHGKGGDKLAEGGLRGNISITDGRNSNDGPVDTLGYTTK